jgi:hypothetical protein
MKSKDKIRTITAGTEIMRTVACTWMDCMWNKSIWEELKKSRTYIDCEISGSHEGDYEDESLLGYSVSIVGVINITLTMKRVRTSETSVYSKTTRRYTPEDLIFRIYIVNKFTILNVSTQCEKTNFPVINTSQTTLISPNGEWYDLNMLTDSTQIVFQLHVDNMLQQNSCPVFN